MNQRASCRATDDDYFIANNLANLDGLDSVFQEFIEA